MADEEQAARPPAQIYQTPDWETPTANKRRSLFDRFVPASATPNHGVTSGEGFAKENSTSTDSHHAYPAVPAAAAATASPKTHPSLHARFDALLPPNKTYAGLSRKKFLLFVALPLAVLLLFVLPLALGLGLSKRGGGGGKQDLPLPTNEEVHTGDLTYYDVGLGACGYTSSDSDMIVSVSHYLWDAVQSGGNPNNNPLCGKKIRVRRDAEGSVDVTVVDRCTGCKPTDLDLSPAGFERLADKDEGRVKGTWSWLD
ncbi:RlpA-like double-psi beta-barrel-protein domain-containing protein-containing protein [Colletotrichum navitas]|uniref:RlpA-like double-psi beta-barrel-protein domain-containing protein-containing protein n=1 Tax=Colletotrichum navitas TaxID=681940 RepID=A0AAD8PVQ3_9PEZI|nr:RlpA-like double-psi beta-barrel-protein domain-containing protein-containing protein [Colletotrichum navitas]KAK1584925.1 RlpA-like double-psi beta-barrel-protein domain-containing protein-containing protein [Colletotrichum navitas]